MTTIKFLAQSGGACPTVFNVKLSGDTDAYIRFRWGYIALNLESTDEEIVGERISDNLDGVISLEDTVKWLESKNYKVI